MKWKLGDRVTRELFLDDGTWYRKGDTCLKDSPLKHGSVIAIGISREDEIIVRWDNGTAQILLEHGVNREEKSEVAKVLE